MPRGSVLFIDLSNQAYKAAAAHANLTSGDTFTGGLYGFIMAVCKVINAERVTRIAMCEDSRPYVREYETADYKGDRDRDPLLEANASVTKKLIRELCVELNIPIWAIPGFESDDIIAWGAAKYRHRFDASIGMSNDSDLYQLFEFGTFKLYKGKKGVYSREDFESEFGPMTADELRLFLAMVGTHNAVKGIPRVGEVTAAKIIRDPAKLRATRQQHKELIDRNVELIILPHSKFPKEPGLELTPPKYNERSMIRFLSKYDVTLMGQMRTAFELISS